MDRLPRARPAVAGIWLRGERAAAVYLRALQPPAGPARLVALVGHARRWQQCCGSSP